MFEAVQRSGRTFSRPRTRVFVASTISTPIRRGKGWPERISVFSATVPPLFLVPSRAILAEMESKMDLHDPALVQLPAAIAKNERMVERSFWTKLLHVAGRIPFAEEIAAAYFCAV